MATSTARPAFLRKAMGIFNLSGQLNSSGTEAIVRHPGIGYNDFGNGKYPVVWSIQKVLECCRFYAHHVILDNGPQHPLLNYDALTTECLTFLHCTKLTIEKAMYDPFLIKAPLDICIKLGHVGTSSLSTTATIRVAESNELLASNTNQVVAVDPVTRIPMLLSGWWIEKYSQFADKNKRLFIDAPVRPVESPKFEMQVAWADTDFYCHSNWTSYPRYCVNAANWTSHLGLYPKTAQKVIQSNAVRSMEMKYAGESIMGDRLDVCSWEIEENSLQFDLLKGDTSVCYGRLDYYVPGEDIPVIPVGDHI